MDRVYVSIFDNDKQRIKVYHSSSLVGNSDSLDRIKFKFLNYDQRYYNLINPKNFVIHPNETLYFESYIILPFGDMLSNHNYEVLLDNRKKYSAVFSIHSDSTYHKKILSRTDLRTIKENGYEVFNGVVTSENEIPIIIRKQSVTKGKP